jgi:hypothetical protein
VFKLWLYKRLDSVLLYKHWYIKNYKSIITKLLLLLLLLLLIKIKINKEIKDHDVFGPQPIFSETVQQYGGGGFSQLDQWYDETMFLCDNMAFYSFV